MTEYLSPLAVDTERLGIVVRGLAVVGGAVLGGFGVGAAVQGGAKLLSGQKVPRGALQMIRALAALATGWIAFLIIAGSGGSGLGGPGGDGFLPGGDGSGKSSAKGSPSESVASGSPSSSSESPTYNPDAHTLDVELLDVKDPIKQKRVFRIKGTKEALTDEELVGKLRGLREQQMPKLDTVNLEPVGKDYPSEFAPMIQNLKQLAGEEKITVRTP